MKLVIHAHALKNESLSQAITGHFDERGGTIGRSDTNTLTLPDPERHVSRLQAEVLFAGRTFSIRNVGSANPIELNGRALRPGEGAPLAPGDQLVIGGYAMRVVADKAVAGAPGQAPRVDSRTVIRGSAGEARTDPPRGPALPAAAPATPAASSQARRRADPVRSQGADPFADLVTGPGGHANAGAAADPFADLLGAPPATLPPVRGKPAPPSSGTPAVPAAARPLDEFDPFADLAPAPRGAAGAGLADFMHSAPAALAAPAAAPKRLPSDPGLDDLLGIPASPASSSGLDSLFGLGGQGGGKDAGDLLEEFLAPAKSPTEPTPGDVLDLFGDAPTAPSTTPAAFNHTPELAAAYAPPTVKIPAPASPPPVARKPPPAAPPPTTVVAPEARAELPRPLSAPPPPSVAATGGAASADALWKAFCEGAGLSMPLQQGLTPQMMRTMGQLMHHAVEGALKLVASRAAAKQELRAQVTTIQSKNNNPLKFSVDPQQALAQLLQPPMRGFMPGPDAVRDAMDDLLGHQIGTMAGTRAALQGMFKRFEPALLEAKLANKGVIDAVLPMNRRAKLWELYVQHYQQVQDEAQDDFHELFGKAFVKAYEQQLDRLESSRRKGG
jgi:FHA domain-containing protein